MALFSNASRLPNRAHAARGVAAAALIAVGALPAAAQTATSADTTAPVESATPSGLMIGPVKLSVQINSGILVNPGRPADGLNFGHLFTDHANQFQLNQVLLTAQKALDPKDTDYQWGFKIQLMYGSDARYTQFLGELNRVNPDSRYQFDVVEANVQAHLPWFTEGGLDLKAGQYATPLGYETIDPATNLFYSHSYIFQFGLPFKHTGALTVTHVNSLLDIYMGADTGSNTTFGPLGDNNGAIGGIAGFGLNLMDGKLTVLALTHFGPEQATRLLSPIGVDANGQWRYFNDVLVTWKATDKLTLVTEANLVRDGYGAAGKAVNGFGLAQYASYALTDTLALNGRAEYWRDDNNFFVASFPSNSGPVRAQQGFAVPFLHTAPGTNTTYGSLTLGVTWKPELPAPVSGLLIRPEVRWDHAFTNNRPFNAQRDNNAFTIGADFVLTF